MSQKKKKKKRERERERELKRFSSKVNFLLHVFSDVLLVYCRKIGESHSLVGQSFTQLLLTGGLV